MSTEPTGPLPSTPHATAQVAQEHNGGSDAGTGNGNGAHALPEFDVDVAPGVTRASKVAPYERQRDDPVYRPLRIFTLDPAQPRLEGATALVDVPYEPLEPGPIGRVFEVDTQDRHRNVRYACVDLDAPRTLIANGRDPSPSDVQFHQQMVYAVCSSVYAGFKAALGRNVAWSFERAGARPDEPLRLRLVPHAMYERNAHYSRETGEICFGYYQAGANAAAKNPSGGYLFTCLSHDIITHELGHALLDGLREHFLIPTRVDVLAFHEAFGDLVAIFQHFAYEGVVAAALKKNENQLERSELLGGLARQFGYTTESKRSVLRTAIEETPESPRQYKDAKEIHLLGSVLVSAVFEAFTTLFRRKTERYVRLATDGTGVLGPGGAPPELHKVLADEASQLATQILCLCIRAIDYCPPVDVEFGDFLRAMITADSELVSDDPWAYREALVDAFGRRGIFPRGLRNLSEDSLRWWPPARPIDIPELSFSNLRFAGDPGVAASPADLDAQARALGRVVAKKDFVKIFGLAMPDGREYLTPTVNSIRTSRRVGPDGQVLFDLVAEVTQARVVPVDASKPDGSTVLFYGGATLIVDPKGGVRYVVVKNVASQDRLDEFRAFLDESAGNLWAPSASGANLVPAPLMFQKLHDCIDSATSGIERYRPA